MSYWEETLSNAMTSPNTIDASQPDFDFDGPIPPKVGSISGTLTISGFPGVGVEHISLQATQPMVPWYSHSISLDPGAISGGSLTNAEFEIGLYGVDQEGTFSTSPSDPVTLAAHIAFADGTDWSVYFDNGGTGGWTTINHNSTNTINPGSVAIPATKVVTGTVSVTLPAGKTLARTLVGLLAGTNGYWSDKVEGAGGGPWKIRIPDASTSGTFMVDAKATDETSYHEANAGSWTNTPTGNTVTHIFP
jgi:hypothetical protein